MEYNEFIKTRGERDKSRERKMGAMSDSELDLEMVKPYNHVSGCLSCFIMRLLMLTMLNAYLQHHLMYFRKYFFLTLGICSLKLTLENIRPFMCEAPRISAKGAKIYNRNAFYIWFFIKIFLKMHWYFLNYLKQFITCLSVCYIVDYFVLNS